MSDKVRSRSVSVVLPLLLVLVAVLLVYVNEQRLLDWVKLRDYTPPTAVAALVADNTMTSYAEHLFFVNKPVISNDSAFTSQCPTGAEKTVVLGCYKSGDRGIYLYKVTDSRLDGVIQVTAAHEMLHAAYARLSSAERNKVDQMLESYYKNELKDERVKKTIAQYQKTEPDQIQNEMHSVFGTELAGLPAELETYYARYFTNRAKVIAYMNAYEAEFTSRQDQITSYDSQLQTLKKTIEINQSTLTKQREALSAQLGDMNALQASGDVSGYNQQIASYNRAVKSYNALLAETRAAIASYNQIVDARNALALEAEQLTQAMSAQSLPTAP